MSSPAPETPPPVASIVVVAWNRWALTAACLGALARHTRDVAHEVIVVDNGSRDETAARLAARADVRVVTCAEPRSKAAAANLGASAARGQVLVFLDNDTEPQEGWLAPLVAGAAQASAVTALLAYPDGTVQHAGYVLAYGAPYPIAVAPVEHGRRADEVRGPALVERAAIGGSCLAVARTAFDGAGGFDESFETGWEDVDLCLRLRAAGGRVGLAPHSRVLHHEAASGGRFRNEARNVERFQARWIERWLDRGAPFEFDYRPLVDAHRARAASRTPASVIVLAGDDLATFAPCLESARGALGAGDELVVVPTGCRGACEAYVRSFVTRHGGFTRLLSPGAARPVRAAVEGARHDRVVILAANVKLAPDSVDRLVAAVEAAPETALVTPTLAGPEVASPPPPNQPRSREAGRLIAADFVEVTALAGRRATLLAGDPDRVLEDPNPAALADPSRGPALVCAQDVAVGRLGAVTPAAPPTGRVAYLRAQSARLAASAPAPPLASIVVLVRDNLALTRACLESVYRHTRPPFEIILIDNGSGPDVAAYASVLRGRHGNVVYLRNQRNEGYAYGCNQGLALARGEPIVLLNNDVEVGPGWLDRIAAAFAIDPAIGLVGPVTNATSGAQLVATASYPGLGELVPFSERWARLHRGEHAYAARLVGFCLALRRAVIDRIGGFDTVFGIGNFEDDDLLLRALRAGFLAVIAGDVFVHHHGSATFRALKLDAEALCAENRALFFDKWGAAPDRTDLATRAEIAGARPFDPRRDVVPLRYGDVFRPDGPVADVGPPGRPRFLLIPDVAGDRYRAPLADFVRSLDAPATLVVRVEPSAHAARAEAALRTLLAECPPAAPLDVVLHRAPLAPHDRAAFLRAMSAFVPCGHPREPVHLREAHACGVPVVDASAR